MRIALTLGLCVVTVPAAIAQTPPTYSEMLPAVMACRQHYYVMPHASTDTDAATGKVTPVQVPGHFTRSDCDAIDKAFARLQAPPLSVPGADEDALIKGVASRLGGGR
jgi:hypothetical protein